MSSRMIPRVLTLTPGVVASMAKAMMAPSTIRKMPTPRLIFHRPSRRRSVYEAIPSPRPSAVDL
jgi:hypothetical protein